MVRDITKRRPFMLISVKNLISPISQIQLDFATRIWLPSFTRRRSAHLRLQNDLAGDGDIFEAQGFCDRRPENGNTGTDYGTLDFERGWE